MAPVRPRRLLELAGSALVVALVAAPAAALVLSAPRASAQEQGGPGAIADKDGYCNTCGNKIGDAKTCTFCGAGGPTYPKRPATPPPAPAKPPRPADDAVPPTEKVPVAGAPSQTAPGVTKPDEMPRVTVPGGGTATAPGADKPATEGDGADPGTDARSRAYRDDNMAKGDYYFKTGYYLKASEAYRVAVLAEPTNPWKKLAFGHALFAIGNYSYSSYALRRATTQLDGTAAFQPDVASLFPSKRAFEKAVKDLKRYVTYSPRDPAGLSVLGYMLFSQGEDDRAREMFVYLQRLPKNDQDPFAAFFLKQITTRAGKGEPKPAVPELTDPRETKVEPPKPAPPPAPKPVAVTPPEAGRQDEEPAKVKPAKGSALAE